MKPMRVLVAAAVAGAMSAALPSPAAADPTKNDDQYGYTFKDDLLQAGQLTSQTAQIRVLNNGRRDLLIRPRAHFVQEMLKSVEHL